MINLALIRLRPGCSFFIDGSNYEDIKWMSEDMTIPSKQEVEDAIQQIKLEYERDEYKRKRKLEYPPISDQLDALFKAGVFPTDMAAKIQAIKDKYPKPI
jgi:hypothetical protein